MGMPTSFNLPPIWGQQGPTICKELAGCFLLDLTKTFYEKLPDDQAKLIIAMGHENHNNNG